MGDAMDGVVHGQRPIATPRPRIKATTIKKTSKRKSAGGSTQSSSATSLNPTPSKKAKLSQIALSIDGEESWATIAQNHTALLESHANFLSKLLAASQPKSSRTPALVGFLSRTHEMLAQVKTIEAISPPTPSSPPKPEPNTSLPRQRTPPKKMENLAQDLRSVALESKKRSRSPSPSASPEKLEDGREESPMKKIKSAPETPVGVMKSSLKSKLGIRTAGAQFSQAQIPRTPTVVTASTCATSSNFPSVKQEENTEVKVEAEDNEEVSLMEPDDFAAEVAARLKAKEKKKHRIVEGSKAKRRRRSSTVDVEERRREKRVKRESLGAGQEVERKVRRRISEVLRGEGGEVGRGRS